MALRQLVHPVDVLDRGAKAKKVLHQLLAGVLVRAYPCLDYGSADHTDARVRAHEVEVVDVVAETVDVGTRLHAVAQLEPEVMTALAVAVHRLQPELHHGLRDGARIPIAGAVDDVQLHCCCCCGIPRPSSPATAAGTLLGWKYVSRSAISSVRSKARHSPSNSSGLWAMDCVLACW